MYVGHVAAGIAWMCHRGNHAGNAEAHLTTLPPCIYLSPAIPYIFTVSVLPQTVFSLSAFLSSFSASPLAPPRHVAPRNSRDAEIRTRKYGNPACPRILIPQRQDLEASRLAHFNYYPFAGL